MATLARWQFAHAWTLDDTDTWIIEITPKGITCNRPSLDNPEAEQVGRQMMLKLWSLEDREDWPWPGTITVKRGSSTYDKDA